MPGDLLVELNRRRRQCTVLIVYEVPIVNSHIVLTPPSLLHATSVDLNRMRFTFPTTTIASIGGAAYLATSTAVAASVSVAYENPGSIRAASKTQQGAECSFEKGDLRIPPPSTEVVALCPKRKWPRNPNANFSVRSARVWERVSMLTRITLDAVRVTDSMPVTTCQSMSLSAKTHV